MKRIKTRPDRKLTTLQKCRYFDNVSEHILQRISLHMWLYRFDQGESVFWEGEESKGLYIVERGSVKLFKISKQGREMVLQVFYDGESFNEVPVFDGGTNPVSVSALETSDLWIIDAETIRTCINKYPEVSKAIILNLSVNLRMLVEKVEELSFYQVTTRLARLISGLPEDQLVGKADIRLTRDELAARLGTVREVVARSLRELERSGAIKVSRKRIEIINGDRLNDWTQS